MQSLADLNTEDLVALCVEHSNPDVIREVIRIGDHRRASRGEIQRAAQRLGCALGSISHWFGYGVGLDGALVDLEKASAMCHAPQTLEAGLGLMVWMHTRRPERRVCIHNKH